MGKKVRWTFDTLKTEALKFSSRKEFEINSRSAYDAARYQKVLDDICGHMIRRRKASAWTLEEIKLAALEFTTKSDFLRNNSKAYQAASESGVLTSVCDHMQNMLESWDILKIETEALKYHTRCSFQVGNPNAYQAAIRFNVLNYVCKHMVRGKNGYDPSKNGWFYMVLIYLNGISYLGYGITNLLSKRIKEHTYKCTRSGATLLLHKSYYYSDGTIPEAVEKTVKRSVENINLNIDGFKKEATYLYNINQIEHLCTIGV